MDEDLRVIKVDYDPEKNIYTKYVEKDVEEVRIVEVPRVEYVDVIKQVPEVKIETVERIVDEVFVDEVVREVPVIHEEEIVKHVPVRKVVEVPTENIKTVSVDKRTVREEIVEVPGEVIEHERHYEVENHIPVPQYHDKFVPTVFQQTVRPVFKPVDDAVEVPVYDYDPVLCKVMVHIPKPVPQPVWMTGGGALHTKHTWLAHDSRRVPTDAEYNHLVKSVNPHLKEDQLTGILMEDFMGKPIPSSNTHTLQPLLVPPLTLPKEPRPDPRPLRTANYVNAIAREAGVTVNKKNPDYIPAISALNALRQYKYMDPAYERYLKEHHLYFGDNARLLSPTESLKLKTGGSPQQQYPPQPPQSARSHTSRGSRSHAGSMTARRHVEATPANPVAQAIAKAHQRSESGAPALPIRRSRSMTTHRIHANSPRKAPTIKLRPTADDQPLFDY